VSVNYRFGEFHLDTKEEVLFRGDAKISINRRTYQVLLLLVQRAGEIVTKQEFFDTVWADTFVEDNSLTVAVTALRKVLGDSAKNPGFIENLPRKGYRFIAKVTTSDEPRRVIQADSPVVSEPPGKIPARSLPTTLKGAVIAGGAVLLFGVIVLAFVYARQVNNSPAEPKRIDSIAVLPFRNADVPTDYISDGLTDELIVSLGQVPGLRVINRNSSFRYRGREADLNAVGRELNVRSLVTGKLVMTDGVVSASVALTDLHGGGLVWSREYSNEVNVLSVRRQIADDLRAYLGVPSKAGAERLTSDPAAYMLYLEGLFHRFKKTSDGYARAIELFEQAVGKDPDFAPAYALIAHCYLLREGYFQRDKDRTRVVLEKGRRALDRDPQLGEVHTLFGLLYVWYEQDWVAAEREFKRAIELRPNFATAHSWYAELLALNERYDDSISEYSRALELDPLSMAIRTDIGRTYFYAGNTWEALDRLEQAKLIDPDYRRTYEFLSEIHEARQYFDEAITELEKYCRRKPDETEKLTERLMSLRKALNEQGAKGYLSKKLDFAFEDGNGYTLRACLYAQLGETDRALALLEQAFIEREVSFAELKVKRELRSLRNNPRFASLLQRLGAPR
jgi:DNA-binding winged helix-turn-helix (wHTH) protein/TolB-like protein/Tfp pilus assembly protein PilF